MRLLAYVPGLHISYRRELRSDEGISLGYLAGIEIHRINIDSSSEFNGKYYQTKDYFQLKDPIIYPMLLTKEHWGIWTFQRLWAQGRHRRL